MVMQCRVVGSMAVIENKRRGLYRIHFTTIFDIVWNNSCNSCTGCGLKVRYSNITKNPEILRPKTTLASATSTFVYSQITSAMLSLMTARATRLGRIQITCTGRGRNTRPTNLLYISIGMNPKNKMNTNTNVNTPECIIMRSSSA